MSAEKILRFLKQCFYAFCIIYFPVLVTLIFTVDGGDVSFWGKEGLLLLKALAFSLVSFPIYISLIGVARFAFALAERKSRPLWEIIAHGILLIPCLCCFASWIYIQKLIPVTVFTTLILLIAWTVIGIVKIVISKRPPYWISYIIRLIGGVFSKPSESALPKPLLLTPLFWLITFLASLTLCIGCVTVTNIPTADGGHEQSDFICNAEFDKESYGQGEKGSITTELLNRSGKTYTYSGSYSDLRPTLMLIHTQTGQRLVIDELPATNDYGTYKLYDTEIRYTVFYFSVPHDAPLGDYELHISFKDYSNVIYNAITVTGTN